MAIRKRTIEVDERFNLDATLDMARTHEFRWRRWQKWHSGVLNGHLVHIRQVASALEYCSHRGGNLDQLLQFYFRLDEESEIADARAALSKDSEVMARLVERYPAMRAVRQPDPWECTVAFICSGTNGVEDMGRIVEEVARKLGSPVDLDGDRRHTFPTQSEIPRHPERLEGVKVGMKSRRKAIRSAANLDLKGLAEAPYGEAVRELQGSWGIGAKIADCIALFGLGHGEAFPTDRWLERAVPFYFPETSGLAKRELAAWAQSRFGGHAGYANQLLFRAAREDLSSESIR